MNTIDLHVNDAVSGGRFRVASFVIGLYLFAPMPVFAQAEEGSVTVEEFLQKLSTVPDIVTRKDPFVEATPPFATTRVIDSQVNISAPVMQRYAADTYTVVAVLLYDEYPRALVRLPDIEKNKVVVVREKDKLGNRGGVITRIGTEGVVVVQNQRSSMGFVDKAQVILPVGGFKDKEQVKR